MGKIFCLMGKSSSGKDTIFKRLKGDTDLKLKPIVSYTTRPRRDGETNGVDYWFVDEPALDEYKRLGKIIEQREYDTVYGKWYYATVNDGQFDLSRNNYVLIGTLPVYLSLQNFFGKECVVPVYIEVDDAVRLTRALEREKSQQRPNYNEMCRRFLADSIDFGDNKLAECGITKYYCNNNLEQCIQEIKADILKKIS